jgi:Ca2+-transporting ATPase
MDIHVKKKNIKFEYPIKEAYALTVESLVKTVSTEKNEGISDAEASKRSIQFGLNRYKSQKQKSIWRMAFEQFNSPILCFCCWPMLQGFPQKNHS